MKKSTIVIVLSIIILLFISFNVWAYLKYNYEPRQTNYILINGIYIKCNEHIYTNEFIPNPELLKLETIDCKIPGGRTIQITKSTGYSSYFK